MMIFLRLNGLNLEAPMVEQERVILSVAAGGTEREVFNGWVKEHVVQLKE